MKILASGLENSTLKYLENHGIVSEISNISCPEDLDCWISSNMYDVGVIHLEKCRMSYTAIYRLRIKKVATPIVGISSEPQVELWKGLRATFLENGGDDLLQEPLNVRELVASLRVILRRIKSGSIDILERYCGSARLRVNVTKQIVYLNDTKMHLTRREQALLILLASNSGRVLSRANLMSQMYMGGVDDEPDLKIIDVFISHLRKKLVSIHPDAINFIETVRDRGYRLREQTEMLHSSNEAA
ncbi:MAG TPA: winged helix-turn-helix domain-containing protein [Candidatus Paceibacterota bacterium]|nr:winged helix-turn-helix domain-containing protein [Candidatus Paceibacterota bacterium]